MKQIIFVLFLAISGIAFFIFLQTIGDEGYTRTLISVGLVIASFTNLYISKRKKSREIDEDENDDTSE